MRRLLTCSAAVGLALAGLVAPAPARADVTPACTNAVCTVTFPAAAASTWVVPAGVQSVQATLAGGSGGGIVVSPGDVGGAGGQVVARIPVTAGDTLTGVPGARGSVARFGEDDPVPGAFGGGGAPACELGAPGFGYACGPGGGGGSFLFATTGTDAARLLAVAGGGGGGGLGDGVTGNAGGAGGAGSSAAADGRDGADNGNGDASGAGGSQSSGGGGAGTAFVGTAGSGPASTPDTLGVGGTSSGDERVGSGGGGLYGGGGGGSPDARDYYGSGGGGSGFLVDGATVVSTGTNTGAGAVTLTYAQPSATSTTLKATPSSPFAGSRVALTAPVTASLAGAGDPSGSVEFFDGATSLGTATLRSGIGTMSTSLAAGTHRLTARYAGGDGFFASTSNVLEVLARVAPPPTPPSTSARTTTPRSQAVTSAATTSPAADAAIAATGAPTGGLLAVGLLLVLAGSGVLLYARRRPARHS